MKRQNNKIKNTKKENIKKENIKKENMKKRIIVIIIISLVASIFFIKNTFVYGQTNLNKIEANENAENIKESISEASGIDGYVEEIEKYIEESGLDKIDVDTIKNDLIKEGKIDYKNIFIYILDVFFDEFAITIKSAVSVFIIILIIAIISALELENKSDVTKIAHLACFFALATITITNFIEIIDLFKNTVSTLTILMQVISPFLMGILLSTGFISSTGIIQPILLFIASSVGFIINYIVIPFISISIALNVISAISDNLKFDKLSKTFLSVSLWLIGIIFTVFLGVLSLEGTLGSSIDALAVKTTQVAVSNFVPVVGKFFSDSFETVVGATKIIASAGGFLGIIAIVIIALIPVLKLTCVAIIYTILSGIIEPICNSDAISKYITGLANSYKTILGVLIGVAILFIISTGITINLVGQVIR